MAVMEQIKKKWWEKGYLGSIHLSEVSVHILLIPLFVVYGRAEHHGGRITLKERITFLWYPTEEGWSPYGVPEGKGEKRKEEKEKERNMTVKCFTFFY